MPTDTFLNQYFPSDLSLSSVWLLKVMEEQSNIIKFRCGLIDSHTDRLGLKRYFSENFDFHINELLNHLKT